MNEPTPQQRQAMAARGNVLVAAGAGSGKTRTLVERCLAWILDEEEKGSVDDILMVTFTEAAATEMRQRLRDGLEAAEAAAPGPRLREELALLETAQICTLHSFCFHLVSQHFYELGLDGPLSVLSAEKSKLLASEALDGVLNEVYEGRLAGAREIQEFIKAQGGDWDKPTRELARRAHQYRHSLRDPRGWLLEQRRRFERSDAAEWRGWRADALREWRKSWGEILPAREGNAIAAKCMGILARLTEKSGAAEWAGALEALGKIEKPKGSGPLWKPIQDIFSEAEFLRSVCAAGDEDPLDEDWNWARGPMLALLNLTEAYGAAYAAAKRAAGGVDFQDLEQGALQLLWDGERPSAVAEQWRRKFRLILVDEFQDINGAQEAIIEALGRPGTEANRFLVGDVKQSIYRFRLADPRIFARRQREWQAGAGGAALSLTENFRSHEAIIDFVNGLFGALMRPEIGGVAYDADSRLVFGNRENRAGLARTAGGEARVELHLRPPGTDTEEDDGASATEREARMIGERLRALKRAGTMVHGKGGTRAMAWSDMAVLLRSPRNKVEAYVKAFARLGIPLVAARTGFYDTLEARDLLNLLQTLDNPLQDLPLLGVLRSPLAGFSPRDLAEIRIAQPEGRFWNALTQWAEAAQGKADNLSEKARAFVARFHAWRRQARQAGVSNCLEQALDQTEYVAWLGAQERGAQRQGNVERFLQLTRHFDAERGEGLYRFLRLVEAQQDNEIDFEPGAPPASDAVRLMSIHQSKGLEFPVVALGDLGKRFNLTDAAGRVILDEEYGLCPQIKPADGAQFYPSLAYWLAQRRQKRETYGEEMRLLYVALTRAMEWLILAGTVTAKRMDEAWPRLGEALSSAEGALRGGNYLDWIGGWMMAQGQAGLRVVVHGEGEAGETAVEEPAAEVAEDISPAIRERMDWEYPFAGASRQPAKTSVSALRRQMAAFDGEEAAVWFGAGAKGGLSGAEIGSAHHAFLEAAALEKLATPKGAAAEAARLREQGTLSAAQTAALDLEAVAAFWDSEVGREWMAKAKYVQRELAFTARFDAGELGEETAEQEFVVVQGAVDLAAIMPGEIWIVDFKTDYFPREEMPAKIEQYRPQLALYGKALARIYRRPVTRSWLCFLRHRQVVLL